MLQEFRVGAVQVRSVVSEAQELRISHFDMPIIASNFLGVGILKILIWLNPTPHGPV